MLLTYRFRLPLVVSSHRRVGTGYSRKQPVVTPGIRTGPVSVSLVWDMAAFLPMDFADGAEYTLGPRRSPRLTPAHGALTHTHAMQWRGP